ncbi:vanadium-dependent haloperoxidase [Mariniblastus fucicola]|uniref:PAP2 superfamily protein n=1 Tax=Mariniblastus fucicola TaxID=980251 RepID=A0A5B9PK26_9BACT|nr:vanadium-dependent haloperoxidase [Mariniblastus fucicola]QEG22843.1 PAP2 superfamily protein [Mariniblastus fucicola]
MRHLLRLSAVLAIVTLTSLSSVAQQIPENNNSQVKHKPSAAYHWTGVMLEAAARDVERVGAMPTILSRQMAIPITAMFDAWAAYDDKAVGTLLGGSLRRPESERTLANKETAIAYAMYRTCVDQYPNFADYLTEEMKKAGYDPADKSENLTTPIGIGNYVARKVLEFRHHDGANQLGDEEGSNGEPYSDYTMYRPVNPSDRTNDPDRWQIIPFDDGKGGKIEMGFLTPHWYRVKTFGLESADQFRPGPPPLVGSDQLKQEVDECIKFNASLTPEQKAIVEFMRDGPRSTGQSGHWLKFAMVVSMRDQNDLDRDVKLFFTVGNCALDTFIASWESKRYYDSSRPWTLVRHYYKGKTIKGWRGPGKGVADILGDEWHPYSPSSFITPPFPGYVSGHSCISGGCAEILKLFTGSDECGFVEPRHAGELTESGFTCEQMQTLDGRPLAEIIGEEHASCDVMLPIPTFTAAAELAGISRVMGGYHIQSDNIAGLKLGRDVAKHIWPKIQAHIDGTYRPKSMDAYLSRK